MRNIKSIDYLTSKNIEFKVIKLDSSPRTAEDVQRIYNCPLNEVLKALLFISKNKPVLIVLEGDRRINYDKLKEIINEDRVSLAKLDQVLEITGYEAGSVSPFALKQDILKLIDNKVFNNKKINIGSGDPRTGIEMTTTELRKAWDGKFVDVSE